MLLSFLDKFLFFPAANPRKRNEKKYFKQFGQKQITKGFLCKWETNRNDEFFFEQVGDVTCEETMLARVVRLRDTTHR